MAIGTYAELKAAVATWAHRTDLTSEIPTFIQLAEADIRNDIRVRAMETVATGTVSANSITHPTGMIAARRLVVDQYALEYLDLASFADLERNGSQLRFFTSTASAFKVLMGTDYTLTYWKAFDALSGDSDTNWLLTNAPDVYLWGAMKHSAIYTQDDQGVMKFDALYKGAAGRIKAIEQRAIYSGGPISVRPSVSV